MIDIAAGAGSEDGDEIGTKLLAQALLDEVRIVGTPLGAGPALVKIRVGEPGLP